jgi:hypothetical protein
MFTQAMPAYIDALRQAVPPSMVAPMAQAIGNCQQPMTHRGSINVAPSRGQNPWQQNPRQPGVYTSQAWGGPSSYVGLFPSLGQGGVSPSAADMADMNANWNNGNRYDSQFFFPTNQWFNVNQFYGGPQVNIQGGAQIDSVNTTSLSSPRISTERLSVTNVNGTPVDPVPGPPGANGRDGRPGAPGQAGQNGAIPPGFFAPINYLSGINPRLVPGGRPLVARKHRYIHNCYIREAELVDIPTNAISGGTVTLDLSAEAVQITVPYNISFDPVTCQVTFGTTTVYALPGVEVTASISGGTPADTKAYYVGTTASLVKADVEDSKGFLVKDEEADFFRITPSVQVSANPSLAGIVPQERRVYQQ